MHRARSWLGWVVVLAAVGFLTVLLFPLIGQAGTPAPRPPAQIAPAAPPLAVIPSPVGNVPITPTLALITLILVVVGGAIVTGAILAFLFYRFNRMLVALQNPAPAVQRRVHAVHHPGYGVYLMVFVWLVILTLAEVGITYIPVAHAVIIPFLVVIALVKATLVALFYMHLKYDSPIYSIAVGMPLVLVIIFAWFVLQMQWGLVPPPLP